MLFHYVGGSNFPIDEIFPLILSSGKFSIFSIDSILSLIRFPKDFAISKSWISGLPAAILISLYEKSVRL